MGEIISTLSTDPKIYVAIWLLLPTITIITLLTIDLFQKGIKKFKEEFKDFPFTCYLFLIAFGLLSCVILIIAYKDVKKEEREAAARMFPWWQLKEYGGWK